MEEKIFELLKEKPLVVPRIIFNNYKRLNITEEELIVIIYLINIGINVVYDPINLGRELNIDKFKIMEIVDSLIEKKFIILNVVKNKDNKSEEYIDLDLFYHKIFNLMIETKEEKTIENSDIFSVFEAEFGRTLSPMEYEIIKGWVNANFSYEIIIEALKEATYNGVNNLRYIDKILYEWNKKGFKTKEDVLKEKENYRSVKKEKKDIFDYNWLEDE